MSGCLVCLLQLDTKGFQVDGASALRKNVDFARCFACGLVTRHPRGEKYIAGHCNVSHLHQFMLKGVLAVLGRNGSAGRYSVKHI